MRSSLGSIEGIYRARHGTKLRKRHEERLRSEENSRLAGPDPELVEKNHGGNELDFREIVDRYGNDLYRLALSLVGNPDDAEDILQETFLAGFERLEAFEGKSTVKTWLIGILLRKVARFHRYRKIRRTLSVHLLGGADRTAFEEKTAGDPARKLDRRMDIRKMLGTLSRKHREVVVLREVLGLSYLEIGEALEIPTGTVESRLFRARQVLRERFKEYLTE